MRDLFISYIHCLINDIPHVVYEGTASIFIIGLVVFIAWKGLKRGLQYATALLLLEYIFIIYGSTVLFREGMPERAYDFHPFWSYQAIEDGRIELIPQNIMNVIVFIPIGVLIGLSTWGCKKADVGGLKGLLIVLTIGLAISVSIEVLQYFFMRGFSELDDVMHNTAGCLIGYMMFRLSKAVWPKKRVIA